MRYRFDSVKEVLAKANPPKSGDDLAGVSARDAVERVAARAVLADLTLGELRQNPVVPYEIDEVTRNAEDELDDQAYRAVAHLTVGQFREWLLDVETTGSGKRTESRRKNAPVLSFLRLTSESRGRPRGWRDRTCRP